MTTLKGLFDPKPRCQRNFLLENKRDVKTKSTSNSEKHKKEANLSLKPKISLSSSKSMSPLGTVMESSALGQRQKHGVGLNHSLTTAQQAKKAFSRKICESKPIGGDLSSKPTSNLRTTHYIHKENVPFEWTEVCPSLISHNICHQGVQTDRDEKYNEVQYNLTDECDKKYVQIQSHNCDSTSDHTASKEDMKAHSKEETGSENNHELTGTRPGVAFEDHCDALNCPREQQVNNFPDMKPSNLVSGIEKLQLSPSGKSMFNAKIPTNTMYPPSYRKGVIPGYISKRKTEALASARAKEAVDPNCPVGHVVMPDDERRETLDTILKNYNNLIAELNKIPVRTDTLKMKQRKIEIEKQLDKLEEGIRIFSRSKVYVKLDA